MRAAWTLLFVCACAAAADLEFPPCEQLNPSLCSSDRFKNQCPSVCGGGGSNNGNNGNGNGNGSNNNKGNDKPKGGNSGKKTTTSKPVSTTTEDNAGNTNDDVVTEETRTTRKSGGDKPSTKPSSSSSASCDKVTPCVDAATANAGFLERCKSRGIKETCWDKCRYDVTFDELKKAMLGGKCPIAGMREFLKAGANGNDNRSCCEKTGVLEGKREFCFPFCNPEGETWPAQKEAMKYLPCASQMAQIMKCHWAGITP